MAVLLRRYTLAAPTTGVQHRVYTVPTGKIAILRSLHQGYHGSVVDADIGATINGAGFIWNQKVSQYDSRIWPLSTVLTAGQYVNAQHSYAEMYTMLQVAEMDEADGAQLWQGHLVNVGTTAQSIAVASNKRLRIRELVICNHADTTDWAVYVGGVGHVVKTRTTPRVGNVYGVDFTVNPGESISAATANGNAGHLFMSGVLEDA